MASVRTHVSNFTLHFGPASATGLLKPVRKTDKSPKPKLATPNGNPVEQVYREVGSGEIFTRDKLVKAVFEDDGSSKLVDPNALEEARESKLPDNVLTLNAHPSDQMRSSIYPDTANGYIMLPLLKNGKKLVEDPTNSKWYGFIQNAIQFAEGVTLCGVCKLRGHEGFYVLSTYQGYILLQKHLYPEVLNEFEPYENPLSASESNKSLAVVSKLMTDFNVADYKDQRSERIQMALKEDYDPEAESTNATTEETDNDFDLEAALDAYS